MQRPMMRRTREALAAMLLLGGAHLRASAEFRAEPVSLCSGRAGACPPPAAQRAGLLRFWGGLRLTGDQEFGGLSALRVAAYPASSESATESIGPADSGVSLRFVAVSDSGVLVNGKLLHRASDGWLEDVTELATERLRNVDGTPLEGLDAGTGLDLTDAESLAATSEQDPMGSGELLVGFERLHRVLRYPVGDQGMSAVPVEQLGLGAHNGRISRCEENGGVEAMDFLDSGALLVFCEEPLADWPRIDGMLVAPGWLLPRPSTSSIAYRVHLHLSSAERPVAIARIPRWHGDSASLVSGGLLVLERSWNSNTGNVLRILYIDAATLSSSASAAAATAAEPRDHTAAATNSSSRRRQPSPRQRRSEGCVMRGSLVAELNRTSHIVDNFEGMAVVAIPLNRLRVYIVSDDNFSPSQKTLLHSFVLDINDLLQLPPPRCIYFVDDTIGSDDGEPRRQGPALWVVVIFVVLLGAIACGLACFSFYLIRAKRRQRYLETQTLPTEEL